MGVCVTASTVVSTTPVNMTCTGVPASVLVAVSCSPNGAYSTTTSRVGACRATGTANQVACTLSDSNTTARQFTCMWMQP